MKTSPRRIAAEAVLASVILSSGFFLASSATPGFLKGAGGGTPTEPASEYGKLLVTVLLNDVGGSIGVSGVSVDVAQRILHGVSLNFLTGPSGSVELALQPGAYAVGLTEKRFTLQTEVQVFAGNLTHLAVNVNRTQSYTTFADVTDASGSGTVNTWETMELAVVSGQRLQGTFTLSVGIAPGGSQFIILTPVCVTPLPTFGRQVFIQALDLADLGNAAYEIAFGPEVQATVLSQTQRNCETWLELQPAATLGLEGAVSIAVVNYAPSYSVEVSNALP